jgi:hypothetical protein
LLNAAPPGAAQYNLAGCAEGSLRVNVMGILVMILIAGCAAGGNVYTQLVMQVKPRPRPAHASLLRCPHPTTLPHTHARWSHPEPTDPPPDFGRPLPRKCPAPCAVLSAARIGPQAKKEQPLMYQNLQAR